MTSTEAKDQIKKGISDYEDGKITMGALLTLVDMTVDTVYDAAFNLGLNEADNALDMDDDEYEVTFEDEDDFEDPSVNDGGE